MTSPLPAKVPTLRQWRDALDWLNDAHVKCSIALTAEGMGDTQRDKFLDDAFHHFHRAASALGLSPDEPAQQPSDLVKRLRTMGLPTTIEAAARIEALEAAELEQEQSDQAEQRRTDTACFGVRRAAQQPSGLVKRLRSISTRRDGYLTVHNWVAEAADRIEALEAAAKTLRHHIAELTEQLDIAKAAAAQSSREAALVEALEFARDGVRIWRSVAVESAHASLDAKLAEIDALLAADTPAKPDVGSANG